MLAPLQVEAAPARRALLVGSATDSVLGRVADELGAAGYGVILESEALAAPVDFAQLAQQRHVSAIVDFQRRDTGPSVVIFVTDPERGETTLRQLKPTWAKESESLLALRIVEVLNGSLLELERDADRRQPAEPASAGPEIDKRPDLPPERQSSLFGLSLRGGARGLWLSGELANFVGPEIAVRISHRSGMFFDASAFVTASHERVHATSGTAVLRAFAGDLGVGLSRPVGHGLNVGAGLTLGLLGAWADAEPEAGYRARAARTLSALLSLRGEASYAFSEAFSVYAALGAGRAFPRVSVSLAAEPVGNAGPWLGWGSAGLALQWGR